jgi:DNA-binding transcriptional regulator YiaG
LVPAWQAELDAGVGIDLRGGGVEKLLAASEVAERLGVSVATVGHWCRQGLFPNAQQVGRAGRELGWWVIPESDIGRVESRAWYALLSLGPRPVRLQAEEYRAAGLEVLESWKRRPPRLRCVVCGEEWRAWDWRCPAGCNAGTPPPRGKRANSRLRDARRAAGLTQKQLARAVGVSGSAVSQWEMRGTTPKDKGVRSAVAQMLGADPWGREGGGE